MVLSSTEMFKMYSFQWHYDSWFKGDKTVLLYYKDRSICSS